MIAVGLGCRHEATLRGESFGARARPKQGIRGDVAMGRKWSDGQHRMLAVLATRGRSGGHDGGHIFSKLREAVLEAPWMRDAVEMELLQHGQFRWGAPCSSSFRGGILLWERDAGNAGLFPAAGSCPSGPATEIQSIQPTKPPLPLDLSHEEQLLLALARGWRLVVQDRRWGLHDSHRSVLPLPVAYQCLSPFIVRVFGQCVIGTCGL